MRLVLVGETNPGSRTPQRLAALRDLGHEVTMVSSTPPGWTYETRPGLLQRVLHRLRLPSDPAGANDGMVAAAAAGCDVVVVDNARMIRAGAVAAVRRAQPSARLVWYSEDDVMNPVHRTVWLEAAMPLYDLWVTTKRVNARPEEAPALGARRVLAVDNSFCPRAHAPVVLTPDERARWGAEVAFVGTFEAPRAGDLLALARAGIAVRVWGNGWQAMAGAHPLLTVEGRPVYGDDYRRVVCASTVNLCFLRKGNRDRQTCRSMEIPAMGGFMLHEDSAEMAELFRPDVEAGYFADAAGLVAACRRWLADPDARVRVAAAGHACALASHSHQARWRAILAEACACAS